MVSVQFAAGLAREFARLRGVPECETGYLAHITFTEAFGREWAPRPFHVRAGRDDTLSFYGYARGDAERMRRVADAFAPPDLHAAIRWDTLASKAMPAAWPRGVELGFELRASPTQKVTGGREEDVFLCAVRAAGAAARVPYAEVYGRWLAERLARGGAAELVRVGVLGRGRAAVLRRTHEAQRSAHTVSVPSVLFRGVLRVHDSQAFNDVLGGGVGRQNGFGFGMVLLCQPRDAELPAGVAAYRPPPGRFARLVG